MSDDLKPTQPWGASGPIIWVRERDPIAGRAPVELTKPDPHEYAAGFRARLADIPGWDAAHPSWLAGWTDADTEMLEEARHRRLVEEGREDDYPGTLRLLFDAGRLARENGVPFEESRTQPWKAGWVVSDIQIGVEPAF